MVTEQPIRSETFESSGSPTSGARLSAVLALGVLLGITLLQLYWAGSLNGREVKEFAYTADQAYGHLAMARDLASRSSGCSRLSSDVTPLAGSSSPAWTLALAGLMRIPALSPTGGRSVDEIAMLPLGINLASAALLVLIVGHLVSREVHSGFWMFVLLLAMGAFIPLPLLVMTGTEHLLHACVVLLLIAVGIAAVSTERASVILVLLAMVLTAVVVGLRYEGLAVVVALLLWGWIQGRLGRMVFPLIAGLAVVLATGLFLSQNGGSWAPTPIAAHLGHVFGDGWRTPTDLNPWAWQNWPTNLFVHARHTLVEAPMVWALLLIATALLAGHRASVHAADPATRTRVAWLFVFVVVSLTHLALSKTGEYRHEAYLIAIGVVAIARTLAAMVNADRRRQIVVFATSTGPATLQERLVGPKPESSIGGWRRGDWLTAVLCAVPISIVASSYLQTMAGEVGRDAFVRERLSAAFVRTYFPAGPVLTNNPGVMAYETHARIVDPWQMTYEGCSFDTVTQQMAKAQVALVSPLEPGLDVPSEWKLIGGWHRANAGCKSPSAVRVYAVSDAMALDVKTALRQSSLAEHQPGDVEYWFADVQSAPATKPAVSVRVQGAAGDGALPSVDVAKP